MIKSIKQLYQAPYNRKRPAFAIYRLLIWKCLRMFKVEKYPLSLWDDRKINLHYDNLQSAWIMYNYWVDWEEFNMIKDILKPDDVVVDVGANIGFYTIWMSKFISRSGRIHAFEPGKKSFSRLIENVKINGIEHYVTVNRSAISDKIQYVKFSIGKDGENHILPDNETNFEMISATTLDQYVIDNNIDEIKYLKLDIEGFELNALVGASNLIRKGKVEIVQLEINSQIKNSGQSIENLLKYISETDYTLCVYNPAKKKFSAIDYSPLRENYFLKRLDKTN